MGRAPCCDKANVKKGPWSPEEDAKLKSYIEQNGTGGNWIALPQKIGLKRCGKSCRLRWLNYLRPNIKHGDFSEEEDRIICSLYITIGSRWSIIAAQLPGRTDNDIKNYWNTRLKKKLFGKQQDKHQLVRRGRKIKTENGDSTIVFDDFIHNQSPYGPEVPAVLNPTTPYDPLILQFSSQFPSNSQQNYGTSATDIASSGLVGDDFCRIPRGQFAEDGAGVHILQGQNSQVGELENLMYGNIQAFDEGMQFSYGELEDMKNENGMISNFDWGEISSLISAPLYP